MNRPALIAVTAIALPALWFFWRPQAAPTVPAATVSAPAPPAPVRVELAVADGRRVSGPAVITARQGDEVVLRITADRDDELHLHGYDLSLKLVANQPAELRFIADRSGRFDYELHRAHREIGVLEIAPR